MNHTQTHTTWMRIDISSGVVVGLLATLALVFVPILSPPPSYPLEIPPFREPKTSHAAAPETARSELHELSDAWLEELDRTFDALTLAMSQRDSTRAAPLRRQFAALVGEAGRRNPLLHTALRSYQRQRFLRTPNAALHIIAARHGLSPATSTPAQERLAAWFELRWEVMAANDSVSDTSSIQDTVRWIPREQAQRLAAWALRASCADLLGAKLQPWRGYASCASVRHAFADVAGAIAPDWDVSVAHVVIDTRLALSLQPLASHASTRDEQETIRAVASQAFERARDRVQQRLDQSVTRKDRRWFQALSNALEGS